MSQKVDGHVMLKLPILNLPESKTMIMFVVSVVSCHDDTAACTLYICEKQTLPHAAWTSCDYTSILGWVITLPPSSLVNFVLLILKLTGPFFLEHIFFTNNLRRD